MYMVCVVMHTTHSIFQGTGARRSLGMQLMVTSWSLLATISGSYMTMYGTIIGRQKKHTYHDIYMRIKKCIVCINV